MRSKALYTALVLVGVAYLAISLQSGLFPQPTSQSLAEKWEGVSLDTVVLDPYFGPTCYSDEPSFAACSMALEGMKQRLEPSKLGLLEGTRERFARYKKTFESIQAKLTPPTPFGEEWESIKNQIQGRDDRSLIIAVGINAFLYLHRDPHTVLVPRKLYNEMLQSSAHGLRGIGLSVRALKGEIMVARVLENSPAGRAGISEGDFIVEVDGQSLATLALDEVRSLLSHENESSIAVTVKGEEGGTRRLKLSPEPIVYKNLESRVLTASGGEPTIYLRIFRFSQDICKQAEQALIVGLEQGAQSLILDLRNNPGGPLKEAACVADLFLGEDRPIFEARYFDESRLSEIYKAKTLQTFTYPVITLVDAYTASAAELLAGALQDHQRTVLLGENTYGKGSFQQGRTWKPFDEAVLLETQGLYYLPSGKSPQIIGLTPDIPVDISRHEVERERDLLYGSLFSEPDSSKPSAPSTLANLLILQCELQKFNNDGDNRSGSWLDSDDPLINQAGGLARCINGRGGLAAFGLSTLGE